MLILWLLPNSRLATDRCCHQERALYGVRPHGSRDCLRTHSSCCAYEECTPLQLDVITGRNDPGRTRRKSSRIKDYPVQSSCRVTLAGCPRGHHSDPLRADFPRFTRRRIHRRPPSPTVNETALLHPYFLLSTWRDGVLGAPTRSLVPNCG